MVRIHFEKEVSENVHRLQRLFRDLFWLCWGEICLRVPREFQLIQLICRVIVRLLFIERNLRILMIHLQTTFKLFFVLYKAYVILFSLAIQLIKIWPYLYLYFFVRPYLDSFYYELLMNKATFIYFFPEITWMKLCLDFILIIFNLQFYCIKI